MPRHRQGFPCCVHLPLPHVLPPLPRRNPVGALVARFPTAASLPRATGGSASASLCFEACSAFTRVAARVVAEPPKATRLVGVLRTMSLPPSSAPIATGRSDSCRAGFAPAGEWRLVTAHRSGRYWTPTPGSSSLPHEPKAGPVAPVPDAGRGCRSKPVPTGCLVVFPFRRAAKRGLTDDPGYGTLGTGGVRRLNRSSPNCLNRPAQRTDLFHGLLAMRGRLYRPQGPAFTSFQLAR